ncbi:hypothetical protein [Shewanella sp.]|uniref:hypothetical protein n=1 Tax=Shewanella sp. TaxID=50422 RepID=UPI003A9773F6
MLKILQDLFWQEQFGSKQPLDRDRYFIGLSLLFAVQFALLIAQPLPFGVISDAIHFGVNDSQVIVWVFNHCLLSIGPLLLIAHILLVQRLLQKWWLSGLLGLVNFGVASLFPLFRNAPFMQPSGGFILVLLLLVPIFALMQLYILICYWPLKKVVASHPWLRINSQFKPYQQLTAVGYFWRMVIWSCIVSLLVSLTLYIGGPIDTSSSGWTAQKLWLAILQIGWLLMVLRLIQLRLRNIGANGWKWLAAGVVVIAVVAAAIFIIAKAYFHQTWLTISVHLLLPFLGMLVAYGLLRIIIEPATKEPK